MKKELALKSSVEGQSLRESDFSKATCAVPICVGQRFHDGEKLAIILENLSTKFNKIVLIVTDTLQRWDLAAEAENNESPEGLRAEAIEKGKKWREKNKKTLDKYESKIEIKFWDEFLPQQCDVNVPVNVWDLFQNNPAYKQAVEKSIGPAVTKIMAKKAKANKAQHKDDPTLDDSKEDKDKCKGELVPFDSKAAYVEYLRGYVLEESDVLLKWFECGYDYLYYPSDLNESMYYLLREYAPRNEDGSYSVLRPIRDDMAKKKLDKAQVSSLADDNQKVPFGSPSQEVSTVFFKPKPASSSPRKSPSPTSITVEDISSWKESFVRRISDTVCPLVAPVLHKNVSLELQKVVGEMVDEVMKMKPRELSDASDSSEENIEQIPVPPSALMSRPT